MTDALTTHLDAAWTRAGDPPLCVAFSGGPDSSALLHALAALRGTNRSLRALHVDHGLHADSTAWAEACATFCRALDVPLQTVRVTVQANGAGPEGAAREARYAAFAEHLREGEWLVTAHHREDQAETVLLKLLRGAGPHGLGGMREHRPLGHGQLWRPLLDTPRATLQMHAHAAGLAGIEDPANRNPDFARSYLRGQIMPRLAHHWPQAVQSLAHAAGLQREQADFLDHHADAALATLRDAADTLDAAAWVDIHPALRANVLEHWLHDRGLPAPTHAQRRELERQIRDAAADRVPRIAWPGAEVRVWRGRLHAMAPLPRVDPDWSAHWRGDELALPAGHLRWSGTAVAGPYPDIVVRMDPGGMSLRPHGDRHTRTLRTLYQQAAVPPWLRRLCPLLHDTDGILLGVADLWSTDAGEALFARAGRRPRWITPR